NAGQALAAVSSLLVGVALTTGTLSADIPSSWWLLVGVSAMQGMSMAIMMPARQAMINEVVGDQHIMNAVALNTFSANGFRLLAPALAGILVDRWGFDAVHYVMVAMYGLAVLLVHPMPQTSPVCLGRRNALEDLKAGFQSLLQDTTVLLLLGIAMVSSFL